MSGIAGIIHVDGQPVAPGQVEAMTAAMPYRGPDGINHWRKGNVALGQCMLRTTPESLEETQPLTNEDESLVLVMDGRVDNWEELRQELLAKGAVLRTRADAELVLRAYEAWADDCPDKIIGEYVFFLWDARRQRVFAARDAAGTRHFYYHQGDGWFAFASEIKSLLTLPIKRCLNESRLLDALSVDYERDDEVGTFYQGILRMPAGHAMSVSRSGSRVWRWWNPCELTEQRFRSLIECEEAFKDQLRIAVKCRLRAIKPVGAMLSGGLDSSTIVGLISKEFRHELGEPLRTFSLIREDFENCADWPSIDAVLRTDAWLNPTVIKSGAGSASIENYAEIIKAFDEPTAFLGSLVATFVLDEAKAAGCGSILDGMAGDLHFYHVNRSVEAIFRHQAYRALPGLLAACSRHHHNGAYSLVARNVLRRLAPQFVQTHYRQRKQRVPRVVDGNSEMMGDLLRFLHPAVAESYVASRHEARARRFRHFRGASDQALHASQFMTGLLSYAHEMTSLASLSRGIEPRSPFSDRRLIEFSIRMPLEAKLMRHWYKNTLREISADLLPEKVRWRRNLGGHPGHKFHDARIRALAGQPEVWNTSSLTALSPWLNLSALNIQLEQYRLTRSYEVGYTAYNALILGLWLNQRFERNLVGNNTLINR